MCRRTGDLFTKMLPGRKVIEWVNYGPNITGFKKVSFTIHASYFTVENTKW